jgi:hypothetical protein
MDDAKTAKRLLSMVEHQPTIALRNVSISGIKLIAISAAPLSLFFAGGISERGDALRRCSDFQIIR